MANEDNELHVGDVGTEIGTVVKENGVAFDFVSEPATTITWKFKKPVTGEEVTKTGSYQTDGSDGIIIYVTEAGFLTTAGTWVARLYLEIGSWSGHTSSFNFEVDK